MRSETGYETSTNPRITLSQAISDKRAIPGRVSIIAEEETVKFKREYSDRYETDISINKYYLLSDTVGKPVFIAVSAFFTPFLTLYGPVALIDGKKDEWRGVRASFVYDLLARLIGVGEADLKYLGHGSEIFGAIFIGGDVDSFVYDSLCKDCNFFVKYFVNLVDWIGWVVPFYPFFSRESTYNITSTELVSEVILSKSKKTKQLEVEQFIFSLDGIPLVATEQDDQWLLTDATGSTALYDYYASDTPIRIKVEHKESGEVSYSELKGSDLGITWATPKRVRGEIIQLAVDTRLIDGDGDFLLENGEDIRAVATVTNRSSKPAYSVAVSFQNSGSSLTFTPTGSQSVQRLDPGESFTAEATARTPRDWRADGRLSVEARVTDLSRAGAAPEVAMGTIPTRGLAPARLAARIELADAGRDGFLEPGERGTATLLVTNNSDVDAFDLEANWKAPATTSDLQIPTGRTATRDRLAAGETWRETLNFVMDEESMMSGEFVVGATVKDLTGGAIVAREQSLFARAFQPPVLSIAAMTWNDTDDGVLKAGDFLTVVYEVTNTGGDTARGVSLEVKSGDSAVQVTEVLNRPRSVAVGESQRYTFAVEVGRNFSREELPLSVRINEERAKYGRNVPDLQLAMGSRSETQVVRELVQEIESPSAIKSSGVSAKDLSAWRSRGYALLIGVNQYENDEIRNLDYAVADVDRLRETLTNSRSGLFSPGRVRVLKSGAARDEQPTARNIKVTLGNLVEEMKDTPNARLFVFFSGHGDEKDGENYLFTQDTELNFFDQTSLSLQDNIIAMLDRIPAEEQILIIDACYSGLRKNGKSTRAPGAISQESIKMFTRNHSGRVIVTSTSKDQVSYEDPSLRGGVFTYYLAEGMMGKADQDGDGIVSALESFAYVRSKVSEWGELNGKRQDPRIDYSDNGPAIPFGAAP